MECRLWILYNLSIGAELGARGVEESHCRGAEEGMEQEVTSSNREMTLICQKRCIEELQRRG